MNGVVHGAEAVRSIVTCIRALYVSQEFIAGLADGHASVQRGSSTITVSPGGTCTPGAVLLRSSAGRRPGAASRASSSAWPSTRSNVVSISVVTVAFLGA